MNRNLLLLHGALGTKNQFTSLQKKLSKEFDVHSFDFEGHGERKSNKNFTMNLFAQNVADYLHENEIKSTHIFGYSMGGYVGLNVARLHPSFVEKIITLGTKFDWTKETAEKEIKMLDPEKIEVKVPSFANKLASAHTNNNWKEVVKKTAIMMRELGAEKRLKAHELAEIGHEALLGIGSDDEMVSFEETEKCASMLQNARLKIIEGFPHPIEKVNEKELVPIISDFINP